MMIVLGDVNDVEAAMGVVRGCVEGMRGLGIDQWDEVYPDRKTLEQDAREGGLYLAKEEEACAGIVVINETESPEWKAAWQFVEGRILVVHRLAVTPAWQRKGVGTALMDFAERLGRERGYGAIRLDAFSKNPAALRMYERRGYRVAGEGRFRKGVFYCFEKALGK